MTDLNRIRELAGLSVVENEEINDEDIMSNFIKNSSTMDKYMDSMGNRSLGEAAGDNEKSVSIGKQIANGELGQKLKSKLKGQKVNPKALKNKFLKTPWIIKQFINEMKSLMPDDDFDNYDHDKEIRDSKRTMQLAGGLVIFAGINVILAFSAFTMAVLNAI